MIKYKNNGSWWDILDILLPGIYLQGAYSDGYSGLYPVVAYITSDSGVSPSSYYSSHLVSFLSPANTIGGTWTLRWTIWFGRSAGNALVGLSNDAPWTSTNSTYQEGWWLLFYTHHETSKSTNY